MRRMRLDRQVLNSAQCKFHVSDVMAIGTIMNPTEHMVSLLPMKTVIATNRKRNKNKNEHNRTELRGTEERAVSHDICSLFVLHKGSSRWNEHAHICMCVCVCVQRTTLTNKVNWMKIKKKEEKTKTNMQAHPSSDGDTRNTLSYSLVILSTYISQILCD